MREDRQPVFLARRLRRSMTPQEVKLRNWLREGPGLQGFHFRRQAPIGRYVVDFAFLKAKLIIEVDGSQHGEAEGAKRDAARDQALAANGIRVLRFWNREIDREKSVVMETISAAAQGGVAPSVSLRSPPPPLAGEDQRLQ
jgi:very-short-patch-repair endonuclease